METQIDVDVLGVSENDKVNVRWLICDNGMTVASGDAIYYQNSGTVIWEGDETPPSSSFTRVILEIDRAVKRRYASSG